MMHVHLVFLTKYRRNVFTAAILDDLRGIFASVCAELVEFDGEVAPSFPALSSEVCRAIGSMRFSTGWTERSVFI